MNILTAPPISSTRRFSRLSACARLAAILIAASPCAFAQSDVPANIDNGLRRLLAAEQNKVPQRATKPSSFERSIIRDSDQRILVEIHLNGRVPLATVRTQVTDAGAKVQSENSSYRQGALSAYVPIARVTDIARLPGVLSVTLSHRPRRNVGATTSGGVFVMHTDMLNAQGLDGTGQTIGVLSDSFDTATTNLDGSPLTIRAADDVATDDLPGTGNSDNPNPVFVIEDFNNPNATDEGRAMLQILHDVAPKAKLAFATAFFSKMDFADNIRKLRTDANCDVIVDDVLYTEEPMFSDGIIAQAVDDVVTSSVLSGSKCAYFSSATNYQGGGFTAVFNPVPDVTARAGLPNQNLKLDQVPAALTTGGFHNFNTDLNGPVDISQTYTLTAGTTTEFDFQWNDPFDQTPNPPDLPGVTTDYNILVFDADGNYLGDVSGTSDNLSNQEAIEDIAVENDSDVDTKYQIAITRVGTNPATPVATQLRMLVIDDFGGVGADEYYTPKAPSGHGHNSAANAISVAAYVYDDDPSNPVAPPFTPFVEEFTSPGGVSIFFDSTGHRLTIPAIRLKPEIAAPDGGNTTFFGGSDPGFDYEGDGFPNFFGTSAAAPHAAGLAALLLQKAGGPGSLTHDQLLNVLEHSVTMEHDLDPFFSQATAQTTRRTPRRKKFSGATVTLSGTGNSSNASSRDRNFFTLTFNTVKKGESLLSITIDLTGAGLKFDTTTATGFPLTIGRVVGINPTDIGIVAPPGQENIPVIILGFTEGAFKNGTSISFGIDRDFIGDGGGNTADYMEGGMFTATTTRNQLKGFFVNNYGFGFTFLDGFGLIDGTKAAQLVTPGGTAAHP